VWRFRRKRTQVWQMIIQEYQPYKNGLVEADCIPMRNIHLTITSENDDTTRDNVSDYLIHMAAAYTDSDGQPQSLEQDRYFLLQLNWLRLNHPNIARRLMEELTIRIEYVRRDLRNAEDI
jgi:hypothetical protein